MRSEPTGFKPWKVEYWWHNSAYGMVLGYAWTRERARRRAYKAVFDVMWGGE